MSELSKYPETEFEIIDALYEYRKWAIDPECGYQVRQDAWQHIDQLLDLLRELRILELEDGTQPED